MTASGVTMKRGGLAMSVAVTAAIVGVVYGYDTGSIAGALLFIPKDFSLSTTATEWITTFTGAGAHRRCPERHRDRRPLRA